MKINNLKSISSLINYVAIFAVVAMTFSIASCSKSSDLTETQSKTYKVIIPAQFATGDTKVVADGGATSFSTTEKVYVSNISNGNAVDVNYLSPNANDAHAQLVGDLTGTYAIGNTLRLMYNANSSGVVDYSTQDGTLANIIDAATADVTIKEVEGSTIKTTHASFENLQSIFKFTFKYKGTTLSVKSVTIASGGNKLVSSYDAVSGTDTYGDVTISNSTAQSIVYAALRFTQTANDPIIFKVTTSDDKVYTATKNAPAGGFALSKFFTSTINVNEYAFSVSATKQVHFSPGNLMRTGTTYSFEPQPYPYEYGIADPDYREIGNFAGYGYKTNPATADPTSYFQWAEIISDGVTSDSPKFFTINGFSTWRVLTKNEFSYLRSSRKMITTGVERYYIIKDMIGRVGLLIPPDNATLSDVNGLIKFQQQAGIYGAENVDYNKYISKGFAFLPACGVMRSASSSIDAGHHGAYLTTSTSTYTSTPIVMSSWWNFNGIQLDSYVDGQTQYYSVRLVRDAD